MQHTEAAPTAEQPVLFHTVKGFCIPRNIPHSTFYKLVKAGHIKPVKRGRRTLVPDPEAKRFDKSLPPMAA